MNKAKLFFFISWGTLLQFHTVLAKELPNMLYCPEKIECSKDKSTSSCKIIGENQEYWQEINPEGTVKKGTYLFHWAESTYQQPYLYDGGLQCNYTHSDYHNTRVNIRSKSYYWEAITTDQTEWVIDGYRAYCATQGAEPTSDRRECPVGQIPLIKIINANNLKISAYANGVFIAPYDQSSDQSIITIYNAWNACSDIGLCTINLISTIDQSSVDAGYIVVNMSNKMKIVYVYAVFGFEISHDEKLNSIEVKAAL